MVRVIPHPSAPVLDHADLVQHVAARQGRHVRQYERAVFGELRLRPVLRLLAPPRTGRGGRAELSPPAGVLRLVRAGGALGGGAQLDLPIESVTSGGPSGKATGGGRG